MNEYNSTPCVGANEIKGVIMSEFSKLSEKGTVIIVSILSVTLFSTALVACASGSSISLGRGMIEINKKLD